MEDSNSTCFCVVDQTGNILDVSATKLRAISRLWELENENSNFKKGDLTIISMTWKEVNKIILDKPIEICIVEV